MNELVRYDAACRAVAEAKSFDEVKDIRDKAEWIEAARRSFKPSKRERCCVCGKHKYLAHAHYLTPLAAQFDRGILRPDHSHVWLCPHHHASIHIALLNQTGSVSSTFISIIADMGTEELKRFLSIIPGWKA